MAKTFTSRSNISSFKLVIKRRLERDSSIYRESVKADRSGGSRAIL